MLAPEEGPQRDAFWTSFWDFFLFDYHLLRNDRQPIRLVHSRFGLHVVEVLERESGTVPPYEQVRAAVLQQLHQQSYATALSQYLRLLAARARVVGVDLDAAQTPLVQ